MRTLAQYSCWGGVREPHADSKKPEETPSVRGGQANTTSRDGLAPRFFTNRRKVSSQAPCILVVSRSAISLFDRCPLVVSTSMRLTRRRLCGVDVICQSPQHVPEGSVPRTTSTKRLPRLYSRRQPCVCSAARTPSGGLTRPRTTLVLAIGTLCATGGT